MDRHEISASRISGHPLRKPSLLFLASLLLLCLSCWRLCCCWFSAVMGISAVIVGIPAVTASLLFLASLVPYCCWRPCCYWFPAVWCPCFCWSPAIYDSLMLLAGSLLFLTFLLLLGPYCCWLLCCCCFPAINFPDFPLSFINNCFETKFCFHLYNPRNEIPSFILLLGRNDSKRIPKVFCLAKETDRQFPQFPIPRNNFLVGQWQP